MKPNEQKRFDKLYQRHLRALKLQGYSDKTMDVYARAVRRVTAYYDCCPDRLTTEQLETYFAALVDSHSWSTVKVDRNGLQCFWKHVLKRDWSWLEIVKAPQVRSLPDILSVAEVEQLIGATCKLRYRVFLLTTYSMGLRLRHIQALLGHASPTTTARYAHLTEVSEQAARVTINRLVNTLRVNLRSV
jgi:site-specific recombinase XerD